MFCNPRPRILVVRDRGSIQPVGLQQIALGCRVIALDMEQVDNMTRLCREQSHSCISMTGTSKALGLPGRCQQLLDHHTGPEIVCMHALGRLCCSCLAGHTACQPVPWQWTPAPLLRAALASTKQGFANAPTAQSPHSTRRPLGSNRKCQPQNTQHPGTPGRHARQAKGVRRAPECSEG